MRDAFLVRGFERIGNLTCDGERLFQRNCALPDAVGEGRTLHQLHHQVIRADIVQCADVGMIQRCDGAHFAVEAFAETLGGDLEGHVAAHAGIVGAIDLTHPAFADRLNDFVRPELVAFGQRHRGSSYRKAPMDVPLGGMRRDRGWIARHPDTIMILDLWRPRFLACELCDGQRLHLPVC
jgi:hypothetical protein